MPKRIFNTMGYRPQPAGATPYPQDGGFGFGCEYMQTFNRNYYAVDGAGKPIWSKTPDWNGTVDAALAAIDPTKNVYFDLESWLCTNDTGPFDPIQEKLFAAILLARFRLKNPTFSKVFGAYGYPKEDVNPMNPQSATDAWKLRVADQMNGGEISKLINSSITAIFPSLYPGEFTGTDLMTDSLSWQFKFNQIVIDTIKANNVNNLPIYAFFSPRMRLRKDGQFHFMPYKLVLAHANWIMQNCDGIVLWDWDGYGDPDLPGFNPASITPITWDYFTSLPAYQALKDCFAVFNAAPTYSNLMNNIINKSTAAYLSA